MEEWRYITENIVEHKSGYKLELEGGTWLRPDSLYPFIPENVTVQESGFLLLEGLLFAIRSMTKPEHTQ